MFAYFVYWYVWTQERQFTGAIGIVASLILPGLLAAGVFGSLRLPDRIKINFALCLISIVFSLYGLELAVSTVHTLVGGRDSRTRMEVVEDLRKRGIEAVPAVFPAALWKSRGSSLQSAIEIAGAEALPLGGIARKLTVMCNESGEWITYHSDEHGFNNPPRLWARSEMSIAAVGDSFTFGACVPAERNFVAQIRKHYPATLNLGINGAGPLVEFAAIREFLPAFRPKVTLWIYVEVNDQDDLKQEMHSPLLMRYLREDFTQSLREKQAAVDDALSLYVEKRRAQADAGTLSKAFQSGSNFLKLARLRNALGLVHGKSQAEAKLDYDEMQSTLFREILQRAQALVSGWGGKLYFVYLPSWDRYNGTPIEFDQREVILALVRALDIPLIDMHRVLEAAGDPLRFFPFRRQGHYNEEGYRLVAQTILQALSRQGESCVGDDPSAYGCAAEGGRLSGQNRTAQSAQ